METKATQFISTNEEVQKSYCEFINKQNHLKKKQYMEELADYFVNHPETAADCPIEDILLMTSVEEHKAFWERMKINGGEKI